MTISADQKTLQVACRLDFATFARKGFPILNPQTEFLDNWHISAIAHRLQRVAEGKTLRLDVNMPPRSGKSTMCSVLFPVWFIGNNPGKTVLAASHNIDLARELSNKSRKLMADPFVQSVFSTYKSLDKDTETEITTSTGGGRIAVSVEKGVSGRGGDLLMMDDAQDASDAESESTCQAIHRWYDESFSTRLNQPAKTPIINVQHRLSVSDLSQHLAMDKTWDVLSLPAIATCDETIPLGGDEFHQRKVGDLLHPERYMADYLEAQRKRMGKRAFEAQFQQQPLLEGAGAIDLGLIRRFDELPKEYDARFLSIDAASGFEGVSYSVILACQITNGRLYVFGHFRGKPTIPELSRCALRAHRDLEIDHLVIEKASGGEVLIQLIDDHFTKTSGGDCEHWRELMQPRRPTLSKTLRMEKQLRHMEAGRLFFPKDKTWLPVLEHELRNFPAGDYDDQVDALSQALGFFDWYMNHGLYGRGHWPDAA